MISNEERSNNFVSSVIAGYHLNDILEEGPRKFGFHTGPNHPFTEEHVTLIVEGFDKNGIEAVIKSRGTKRYPSTSLTLEFSK